MPYPKTRREANLGRLAAIRPHTSYGFSATTLPFFITYTGVPCMRAIRRASLADRLKDRPTALEKSSCFGFDALVFTVLASCRTCANFAHVALSPILRHPKSNLHLVAINTRTSGLRGVLTVRNWARSHVRSPRTTSSYLRLTLNERLHFTIMAPPCRRGIARTRNRRGGLVGVESVGRFNQAR